MLKLQKPKEEILEVLPLVLGKAIVLCLEDKILEKLGMLLDMLDAAKTHQTTLLKVISFVFL